MRQAEASPPSQSTRDIVTVWMSMDVPKANMKRSEPIWTRSFLFFVTSAVRAP